MVDTDPKDVHEAIYELVRNGGHGALATVLETSGSVPQLPGARLLVKQTGDFADANSDGKTPAAEMVGTIGGGAIEDKIIELLFEMLEHGGKSRVVSFDLGRDLGMCCGGRMRFFVEIITGAPRLLLFGAGHVAMPTAAMARLAGFHVVVIDDRAELNTEARFFGCERLLAEPVEAAPLLRVTKHDFIMICTHDHHLDEQALDHYARGPHRYLGMIGSKRKVLKVLGRIGARSELPSLERVYSPIGVPINAESPGEIAASIVAELVAIRRGADVAHMRLADVANIGATMESLGKSR